MSIDLPGGPFGGGYPEWRRSLYQSFASPGQDIVLLVGDSHTDEMVASVQEALDGRALDVILIDADHAYEGVRRDFESYSRLIAPVDSWRFMTSFRSRAIDRRFPEDMDICPGDVSRFWSEIRETYESREFVESWQQGGFGIGVLELAADRQ